MDHRPSEAERDNLGLYLDLESVEGRTRGGPLGEADAQLRATKEGVRGQVSAHRIIVRGWI